MQELIIMPNGRHKGELITRIPLQYLKWMVNINHSASDMAKNELERRGTSTPTLEISHHAIDRASLRARKIWHETKKQNEGLYSWLLRMAQEALIHGTIKTNPNKYHYNGIIFVFNQDGIWPVLLTIMRKKNG